MRLEARERARKRAKLNSAPFPDNEPMTGPPSLSQAAFEKPLLRKVSF